MDKTYHLKPQEVVEIINLHMAEKHPEDKGKLFDCRIKVGMIGGDRNEPEMPAFIGIDFTVKETP